MHFKTKLGLVDIPNDEVMAASRDIAGSAGSTSVIAAPSGSLGVGGGCLEVSSAEALCARWQSQADTLTHFAQQWRRQDEPVIEASCLGHADGYIDYIRQLRRLMGLPTSRQPQDNR